MARSNDGSPRRPTTTGAGNLNSKDKPPKDTAGAPVIPVKVTRRDGQRPVTSTVSRSPHLTRGAVQKTAQRGKQDEQENRAEQVKASQHNTAIQPAIVKPAGRKRKSSALPLDEIDDIFSQGSSLQPCTSTQPVNDHRTKRPKASRGVDEEVASVRSAGGKSSKIVLGPKKHFVELRDKIAEKGKKLLMSNFKRTQSKVESKGKGHRSLASISIDNHATETSGTEEAIHAPLAAASAPDPSKASTRERSPPAASSMDGADETTNAKTSSPSNRAISPMPRSSRGRACDPDSNGATLDRHQPSPLPSVMLPCQPTPTTEASQIFSQKALDRFTPVRKVSKKPTATARFEKSMKQQIGEAKNLVSTIIAEATTPKRVGSHVRFRSASPRHGRISVTRETPNARFGGQEMLSLSGDNSAGGSANVNGEQAERSRISTGASTNARSSNTVADVYDLDEYTETDMEIEMGEDTSQEDVGMMECDHQEDFEMEEGDDEVDYSDMGGNSPDQGQHYPRSPVPLSTALQHERELRQAAEKLAQMLQNQVVYTQGLFKDMQQGWEQAEKDFKAELSDEKAKWERHAARATEDAMYHETRKRRAIEDELDEAKTQLRILKQSKNEELKDKDEEIDLLNRQVNRLKDDLSRPSR